jgi:hypothetical protein
MTEETNNTATESTQVTTEASSEETQQVESQSTEQADTTQSDSTVTDSMAIEASKESETSEQATPTIDDIVNEALGGEISEETQKLIDENGLGKHIEMLVAGHQAIQEKNNQEVFEITGGESGYKELQEWGKNSMSAEAQEAFNDALFSGNMNLAKLAVAGLQAQYVAANGQGPDRVIEGGGSANEENRPFSDINEYLKITRTNKYKRDHVFQAEVEAKRNKSGF